MIYALNTFYLNKNITQAHNADFMLFFSDVYLLK